jgi:hypothetical protein
LLYGYLSRIERAAGQQPQLRSVVAAQSRWRGIDYVVHSTGRRR